MFSINESFIFGDITIIVSVTDKKCFYGNKDGNIIFLYLPVSHSANINNPTAQKALKLLLSKILIKEGKNLLPQLTVEWAQKMNLSFNELKIKRVKSRWGSCSSQNNINLSCYLMMLPKHLIDYVVVHELCHVKHKNHGPQFKTLLHSYFSNWRVYEEEMKIAARKIYWLMF